MPADGGCLGDRTVVHRDFKIILYKRITWREGVKRKWHTGISEDDNKKLFRWGTEIEMYLASAVERGTGQTFLCPIKYGWLAIISNSLIVNGNLPFGDGLFV